MVSVEEVCAALATCDPDRVRLDPHVFDRARRRNIDPRPIRRKVLDRDLITARTNHQTNPRYEHSYLVTLVSGEKLVELPLYFNVPGTEVYVASVWPK